MQLGAARFRAPEVLFSPDLIGEECYGVHEQLLYAIKKSDMDLRRNLWANIVLSGGTTMLKGFGERLLNEIKKLGIKDIKVKVGLAAVNEQKKQKKEKKGTKKERKKEEGKA